MQHISDPQEKFSGIELLPLEEGFVLGTWGSDGQKFWIRHNSEQFACHDPICDQSPDPPGELHR